MKYALTRWNTPCIFTPRAQYNRLSRGDFFVPSRAGLSGARPCKRVGARGRFDELQAVQLRRRPSVFVSFGGHSQTTKYSGTPLTVTAYPAVSIERVFVSGRTR